MRSMPAVACGAFFPTPREFKSVVWPLALFLGFLATGSVPRDAYSGEDVFSASGGKWRVSYGGAGTWQVINTSNVALSDLRFGDFDGNCRADVFTSSGGKWLVSYNGTGLWQVLNTSSVALSNLRFGDFDGDGKTDVFTASGGKWRISSGGTGSWQVINNSSLGVSDLRFGDFNGDGKTDVFAAWGGKWRVSFGGTGNWQVINNSSLGVADLRFGDFDGDGKTDVFAAWGGKWRVSLGGTGNWQVINNSSFGVPDLRFGDFDGDGKTDVFAAWGGKWRISSGGTSNWKVINTSNVGLSDLRLGDFNGLSSDSDAIAHSCMRISRFTTASLDNATADAILASASSVLQTKDGPDDVACPVKLTRAGNVTVFATGGGSVNTAAQFNALIALPGHVKVVNQINWCGTFQPGIIGCSPVGGNSQVVVRYTANEEGILWAHEYGHTRGLGHRNDTNAVMNPFIGITETRVNSAECAAFRK